MRGYFHDYQTSDIEGSILWELKMKFNGGMCKWSQYVNALSDVTGCDPGSIIVMAGQLGYKACGVDLWGSGGETDITYPRADLGRGYECRANYNPQIDRPNAAGVVRARPVPIFRP